MIKRIGVIKIPFGFFIVFLLGLIPLLNLLNLGLPVTHDGIDHVARIANFYNALTEGVIFPRWAENLNWGYGHPVLMFLYPFSSYLASFFHLLGFSYIDSLKILFGLGYIASGFTMYIWAREQFDEYVGIASAAFYLYAPYRFVDLYVRGAIGEHMAFIFPPLVLFFILKFVKAQKIKSQYLYFLGLSVSFSLLLLSHNAISIMFVPLFGVYSAFLIYKSEDLKKISLLITAFISGFLLSAFFTIPAYFEGKYTLRDIVTGNEYRLRFVADPLRFLYGKWNFGITGQFSVQLGIINLLGLLILPYVLFSKVIKKDVKILLSIIFVIFLFSLFLQLPVSNFLYEIFTTLKKFQFPWRFLSLATFTLAILASIFIALVPRKNKSLVLIALLIAVLVTTFPFWKAREYTSKPDSFFDKTYYGTTDTGESAPKWSVRFMEKEPDSHMEIIEGNAKIDEINRRSVIHEYNIEVLTDTARLRENTLYFPGWNVYKGTEKQNIEFQDPSNRGLITFELPKGNHEVKIKFEDTKLRLMANVLSLITVILITICGFIVLRRK